MKPWWQRAAAAKELPCRVLAQHLTSSLPENAGDLVAFSTHSLAKLKPKNIRKNPGFVFGIGLGGLRVDSVHYRLDSILPPQTKP